MRDYIELGPTPAGESCAQVGADDYHEKAREECQRYKELLEATFPDPPQGSRFAIKSFPHDFGSYYEVVVWFDDDNEKSVDFAYKVERNLPETWEDVQI